LLSRPSAVSALGEETGSMEEVEMGSELILTMVIVELVEHLEIQLASMKLVAHRSSFSSSR
jgi:hypothetical protein